MKKSIKIWGLALVAGALTILLSGAFKENADSTKYRSPETLVFSPDGKLLASNDLTSNKIYLLDADQKKLIREIQLEAKPQDILWLDSRNLLVSEYETGKILKIDARSGNVVADFKAGPNAFQMEMNGNELLVGLYGLNKIAVLDAKSGKQLATLQTLGLTWDMEMVPGKNLLLVANLIPTGSAKNKDAAATVSVFNTNSWQKIKDIRLPHGSTNFRHLEVSADGKWAYAVHTRGKVTLPTSQIEKGWINTNMLSIIDLEKQEWYASVLLDKVKQGASDPWDVMEASATGDLYVTLGSMHEIARVDMKGLHQYLRGEMVPANLQVSNANAYTSFDVWQTIKADPSKRVILQDQISALYAAGLLERTAVPVKGPRGLAISPDQKKMAVAGYYSGEILIKNTGDKDYSRISLGAQPEPDQVRRGEMFFHDATKTVENWLSCFTCHPDTRADGLNWDLLNDGVGNPKNTKSLVWTHLTPPSMSTGVRPNYEVAVQKGFHFIKFYRGSDNELNEVRAYLASLTPDESPYLKLFESDKNFRKSAEKGKMLFSSLDCKNCHEPPLFTNKKKYDFGYADELGITAYDVPTLRELWRTAPYWHDGSKATIKDLLTDEHLLGVHGKTDKMVGNDLEDLTNYLLTL
jgi:DNA-binding beta-propeller fold protein YncE